MIKETFFEIATEKFPQMELADLVLEDGVGIDFTCIAEAAIQALAMVDIELVKRVSEIMKTSFSFIARAMNLACETTLMEFEHSTTIKGTYFRQKVRLIQNASDVTFIIFETQENEKFSRVKLLAKGPLVTL